MELKIGTTMPETKIDEDESFIIRTALYSAGIIGAYEPTLRKRFAFFDGNNNGLLEKKELGKVIKKYDRFFDDVDLGRGREKGKKYSKEELEELEERKKKKEYLKNLFLNSYDENQDGVVSWEEFKTAMNTLFIKMMAKDAFLTQITRENTIAALEKYKKFIKEYFVIYSATKLQDILKVQDAEFSSNKIAENGLQAFYAMNLYFSYNTYTYNDKFDDLVSKGLKPNDELVNTLKTELPKIIDSTIEFAKKMQA